MVWLLLLSLVIGKTPFQAPTTHVMYLAIFFFFIFFTSFQPGYLYICLCAVVRSNNNTLLKFAENMLCTFLFHFLFCIWMLFVCFPARFIHCNRFYRENCVRQLTRISCVWRLKDVRWIFFFSNFTLFQFKVCSAWPFIYIYRSKKKKRRYIGSQFSHYSLLSPEFHVTSVQIQRNNESNENFEHFSQIKKKTLVVLKNAFVESTVDWIASAKEELLISNSNWWMTSFRVAVPCPRNSVELRANKINVYFCISKSFNRIFLARNIEILWESRSACKRSTKCYKYSGRIIALWIMIYVRILKM